jgi:hypothetical protein
MRNPRLRRRTFANHKTAILLGAMALNFLLTGVDVLMAHSQNDVFRWELIPLVYVPFAVLAILAQMALRPSTIVRRTFQTVMWSGVVVGLVGTLLHLTGNAISSPMSVHQLLVAGSPMAAPIAFAGIASFALASDRYRGSVRRSKLVVLVGLGFFGAVLAAFLDHARLGYVPSYTLIPLVTGTVAAVSCFYLAYARPSRRETYIFLSVLGLNVVVGVLGFAFHLLGDLAGTQSVVWARILYRAPLLGPLLFCNLGMLGALSMLPEPDDTLEGVVHEAEAHEADAREGRAHEGVTAGR